MTLTLILIDALEPVLERLPGGAREKVRDTVLGLHRETEAWDPSPWRGRQQAVARSFGLVRDTGPERYMGAEIGM